MKTLAIALSLATLAFAGQGRAAETTGAGSTFVYPVLAKWAAAYQAKTGGLTIFTASSTPGASRYYPANTRRSMLLKVSRCGDLRRSTLS